MWCRECIGSQSRLHHATSSDLYPDGKYYGGKYTVQTVIAMRLNVQHFTRTISTLYYVKISKLWSLINNEALKTRTKLKVFRQPVWNLAQRRTTYVFPKTPYYFYTPRSNLFLSHCVIVDLFFLESQKILRKYIPPSSVNTTMPSLQS